MSHIDSLFRYFTPVFSRRHEPYTQNGEVGDPERFIFGTEPRPCNAIGPHEDANISRHYYEAGVLAMFALDRPVAGTPVRPVYLLRLFVANEAREYFKLSFALQEDGYEVRDVPGLPVHTPRFYVFENVGEYGDCLSQVYEHAAPNPDGKTTRYKYDFDPRAQGEWGPGKPKFFAITPEHGKGALQNHAGAEVCKQYARDWIKANGSQIAALGKTVSKDMTRAQADAITNAIAGARPASAAGALPKPTFLSLGVGAHAGVGLASVGIDIGAIWNANDFPTRNPIASYSNEQVTLGFAGVSLGASVDAVLSVWFGTVDQIEGACNGVCGTVQAFGGITITLLWTGTWEGANYTSHPIGVAVTASVGPEVGVGFFYIASATQFWRKAPNFPKEEGSKTLATSAAPESFSLDGWDPSQQAAE